MKQLFSLYRRNGIYYAQNTQNGKQESLRTRDEAAAKALLHSKNEASRQPILNRQIALAYLSATDAAAASRTWKFVMDEMAATKQGVTRHRYDIAWKDPAFVLIGNLPLLETNAAHILKVIRTGTVSTNHYMRRMHNFALEMDWLPKSIVPRRQWPKPLHKEKRAITQAEHEAIIANEKNSERRAYYQLAWHNLKDVSRWLDTLAKLDFIHRLQTEFRLQLPAVALAKLTALESWARGEQEKDKKEREFQSLLGKLDHQIHQSEEKDTSARYVKLPELRDDYEAMHKIWRLLTDFTRPIPEEAASNFRKRTALLEAEIARRTAIHRRIVFASSAAVLVVGAIIAWIVVGQMKVSDFSKQLQEAIAQRQVHTADKLLERAHSEKVGGANATATAETFSAKEHALLSNFEASFNKLPQQLTGEADATRLASVADQLALAHLALNALAPDLKTENEPRMQAFEKQWQNFLTERSAAVNGLFDQWVSSAEGKCGELDYRAPLEKTTAQIAALASLVQKITDTESGFTNHLNLRSDLLQRAATVRAKFSAYDGELKKLDEGTATIRKAHTVKEFSDGINVIVSSEFSASPTAAAASLVQTLNTTDETALRSLLAHQSRPTGNNDQRNWLALVDIRWLVGVATGGRQVNRPANGALSKPVC